MIKKDQSTEYLLAYNQTVTKLIMIKQKKTEYKITTFSTLVDKMVMNDEVSDGVNKSRSKVPRDSTIELFCLCKDNSIIMNWIPEKKVSFLRNNSQEKQKKIK